MSKQSVFDDKWVDNALSINSFTGVWRFKRTLKRAVLGVLVAGSLATSFPSVVNAATPEQEKNIKETAALVERYIENKDSKNAKKVVESLVHLMFDMLKTLKTELEKGEYAKAHNTANLIKKYSRSIGLESKFIKKIENIRLSVASLSRNANLAKRWKAALAQMKQLKNKEGSVNDYKAKISGSNWIFEVYHVSQFSSRSVSGFAGGVKIKIQGDTLNLKKVDEAIDKLGLSELQEVHLRSNILRALNRDFPRVIFVSD